jgi:hypothetical protein
LCQIVGNIFHSPHLYFRWDCYFHYKDFLQMNKKNTLVNDMNKWFKER